MKETLGLAKARKPLPSFGLKGGKKREKFLEAEEDSCGERTS